MRIATWNVNSIRARSERVVSWLERHDIDVLAMQETKCADHQFPALPFEAAGYEVAHVGVNQWNGVALASRVGLDEVASGFPDQPTWGEPPIVEPRAVGATCGGVRLWSVYVPNGRELGHPHLAYKLEWLAALRAAMATEETPLAVMGDWNVAPRDDDVWDIDFFAGKTHVSASERAAFAAFEDIGLTDVVRPYAPGPGVHTYWDYTQLRFPKRQGMRIDFVLGSRSFDDLVSHAWIDREERKGKGASDHAPVVVEAAAPDA